MIDLFNTPLHILSFFCYFINVYSAGKFGIKGSTLLGLIMLILGGVFNFFIETNYYWSVVGCTIQALGANVLCCLFAEVANRWFDEKERPLAIAIMMLFKQLSAAFNMIIPNLIIKEEQSSEKIIDGVFYFNIYRIGVSIFFFLAFCICFKEWPTKKLNNSEENSLIENKGKDAINEDIYIKEKFVFKEFKSILCKLFSDKVYLYLNIGFSSGYGSAMAYIAVSGELHSSFGYNEKLVSYLISGCLVVGLAVGIIYTKTCIKLSNQLLIMERMLFLSTIFCTVSMFMLYFKFPLYIPMTLELIFIACCITSYIVIYEETIKYVSLAYGKSTVVYATGLLGLFQGPFGIILNLLLGVLFDKHDRQWSLFGALVMIFVVGIYAISISIAECYIRKSPQYKKLENLRKK